MQQSSTTKVLDCPVVPSSCEQGTLHTVAAGSLIKSRDSNVEQGDCLGASAQTQQLQTLLRRACALPGTVAEQDIKAEEGEEDGLFEALLEISTSDLVQQLKHLLGDPAALSHESFHLFGLACDPASGRLPVVHLFEVTQRVIDCTGCRNENALACVADIFARTSAGHDRNGIGQNEFQSHLFLVLSQILAGLENDSEDICAVVRETRAAEVSNNTRESREGASTNIWCAFEAAGLSIFGTSVEHPGGQPASIAISADQPSSTPAPVDCALSSQANATPSSGLAPAEDAWQGPCRRDVMHPPGHVHQAPLVQTALSPGSAPGESAWQGPRRRELPHPPGQIHCMPENRQATYQGHAVNEVAQQASCNFRDPYPPAGVVGQTHVPAVATDVSQHTAERMEGELLSPGTWAQTAKASLLKKMDAWADSLDAIFAPQPDVDTSNGNYPSGHNVEAIRVSAESPIAGGAVRGIASSAQGPEEAVASEGDGEPAPPTIGSSLVESMRTRLGGIFASKVAADTDFDQAAPVHVDAGHVAPDGLDAPGFNTSLYEGPPKSLHQLPGVLPQLPVDAGSETAIPPGSMHLVMTGEGDGAPMLADGGVDGYCAIQPPSLEDEARWLLGSEGLPAYAAVGHTWESRRLVLPDFGTRMYVLDEGENIDSNLECPSFMMAELQQITRRVSPARYMLSLSFEEGTLLLRFSYPEYMETLQSELLAHRRIPVIEARD